MIYAKEKAPIQPLLHFQIVGFTMKKPYLISLLLIFIVLIGSTGNNTFSENSTDTVQTFFSPGTLKYIIGGGVIIIVEALIFGGWRLCLYIFRTRPIIAGKWKTTFTEEGEKTSNEVVTLKQRGSKVTGEIKFDDEGKKIIYTFKGSYKNLILTATYESTDPKEIERGSFSIQYIQNKRFKGQYVTFPQKQDYEAEFSATKYYWDPIKNG